MFKTPDNMQISDMVIIALIVFRSLGVLGGGDGWGKLPFLAYNCIIRIIKPLICFINTECIHVDDDDVVLGCFRISGMFNFFGVKSSVLF